MRFEPSTALRQGSFYVQRAGFFHGQRSASVYSVAISTISGCKRERREDGLADAREAIEGQIPILEDFETWHDALKDFPVVAMMLVINR